MVGRVLHGYGRRPAVAPACVGAADSGDGVTIVGRVRRIVRVRGHGVDAASCGVADRFRCVAR
jgi:hypothetical protein